MTKRVTLPKVSLLVVISLGISILHFFTPTSYRHLHLVYDRLCYFPVILAAFWFGFGGGVLFGIIMSCMHLMHVWLQWGGHFFSTNLYQTLEACVHLSLGFVTGYLSERFIRASEALKMSYQELTDKTEQVLKVEEQLHRTERIQALAELSAGIAHEIRTPIASIKGAAEILSNSNLSDERRNEFSDILKKETKHLNQVVNEFLHFTRSQTPKPVLCILPQIVDSVLELTHQQMRARNITVVKEFDPHLSSIYFDAGQLKQVFVNLITNAIHAMPEGGTLTITGEEDGHFITCRVADEGPGIPKENLERIFNPFYTTRQNGTGLGLSIVHKILNHHRCSIEALNREEGGAVFNLRFPKEKEFPS